MTNTVEKIEASELAVIAKGTGLAEDKVTGLLSKFASPFKQAQYIIQESKDISVTSEDQTNEMEEARVARLELKRLRVDTEHTRKELKEQSLREGKAIDGMANIIKALIVPVEEHLEKQEKFAERLAAERKARKLAERQTLLAALVEDTSVYKFEDMTDSAFAVLLQQLRDTKKAQAEAEKKARELEEAEHVAREKAAAEEAERIRKENEKLKADAQAREIEIKKQREAEEIRLATERAEQEKKLAAERAKAEEERKKREALEADRLAKEKAAIEAKARADESQRQALLAPDKDKLNKFALVIDAIELPHVSNREAGKVLDETKDYLTRISKNLRQKAAQL